MKRVNEPKNNLKVEYFVTSRSKRTSQETSRIQYDDSNKIPVVELCRMEFIYKRLVFLQLQTLT